MTLTTKALLTLIGITLAKCALGQDLKISKLDSFGARYITGTNGVSGKISRPDSFGAQYFRFSDGVSGKISGPDTFGNRYLRFNQPHNHKPRNNNQ